jgi:hypothetical protein
MSAGLAAVRMMSSSVVDTTGSDGSDDRDMILNNALSTVFRELFRAHNLSLRSTISNCFGDVFQLIQHVTSSMANMDVGSACRMHSNIEYVVDLAPEHANFILPLFVAFLNPRNDLYYDCRATSAGGDNMIRKVQYNSASPKRGSTHKTQTSPKPCPQQLLCPTLYPIAHNPGPLRCHGLP